VERLTYDFAIGGNHCWEVHGADNLTCAEVCKDQGDNGCDNCPIRKSFDRLAAYEDTGLMPEEIVALQASFEELKKEAVPLMRARIEERLVVLPCKVGDQLWYYPEWYAGSGYEPEPLMVEEANSYSGSIAVECYMDPDNKVSVLAGDFGKTVFRTREEAKAAHCNGGNAP